MLRGWPATVDPIQLAKQGAHLSGVLPAQGLRRLCESSGAEEGEFAVKLDFGRSDIENVYEMNATVDGELTVPCQRCLEPMALPLKLDMHLLLLHPGEREEFAEEENALVVEGPLSLSDLIEDELLLSLPMIPMHPIEHCPARRHLGDRGGERAQAPARGRGPFAKLERLRSDKRRR